LKVPGFVSKGTIRSYVGCLVITPQRVLGALSTVPKLAGRAIDPEPVLTTIPRRSLAFEVPREWVLRAVGVPAAATCVGVLL
jgi:hypothetical protein